MPQQQDDEATTTGLSRRKLLAAAAIAPAIAALGPAAVGAQAASPDGRVALLTGSSRGIGAATATASSSIAA